jgi:hypothetical protein
LARRTPWESLCLTEVGIVALGLFDDERRVFVLIDAVCYHEGAQSDPGGAAGWTR